jgi:hypothetical protein
LKISAFIRFYPILKACRFIRFYNRFQNVPTKKNIRRVALEKLLAFFFFPNIEFLLRKYVVIALNIFSTLTSSMPETH